MFRSLFAESIFRARKMVSEGRIMVNGRMVDKPDHRMKDGDMLQVRPKYWHEVYPVVDNPWARFWGFVPEYLEVSYTALATMFIRKPSVHEIPHPFPSRMISNMAAYYSKKGTKPGPPRRR